MNEERRELEGSIAAREAYGIFRPRDHARLAALRRQAAPRWHQLAGPITGRALDLAMLIAGYLLWIVFLFSIARALIL